MKKSIWLTCTIALLAPCSQVLAQPAQLLDLRALKKIAEVDNRFQSYNIEMVEVTGGKFWAPYGGPPGEVYRQRPPIDLANPRLRQLAQLLAPAYVRVSGTWATNAYLPAEGEAVAAPPPGYKQVLTRDMWRGVVAFSKALDAPVVTSFAAGVGTRDAAGVWTTVQAQRRIDLTRSAGGKIFAAEFFNEPNMPFASDMPKGYSAADYVRDFKVFHDWAKREAPDMLILGPGSVGEGSMAAHLPPKLLAMMRGVNSDAMMAGTAGEIDAVSYHYYGGGSPRCASQGMSAPDPADALSETWLSGTLKEQAYYARLRDKYDPGKPMWLTETAQAACGGSPWASTFRDSFRYVSQLGQLAQQGVRVVMHNTLAASDYALIDGDTLMPRPNYWAAVLWAKLMGPSVLAAPVATSSDVRIYAQCLRGKPGAVALVALNLGSGSQSLSPGKDALAYTVTAASLDDRTVLINGVAPSVNDAGDVTELTPRRVTTRMTLPPQSISFIAVANARNASCT
jgi:heparanase 1